MAWIDVSAGSIMIILVVAVAVTASMSVLFGMKLRNKKSKTEEKNKNFKTTDLEAPNISFRISKSVQTTTASNAKDELRILDLEREILGDSIRRLYEAQAEGKITEVERERLAVTYKNRMNTIKESIAKDETIVALHELEGMQEDLMQLFSERFSELTGKVEELRGKIDVKAIKEVPIKIPTSITQIQQMEFDDEDETTPTYRSRNNNNSSSEEKQKKKRKPPTTEKPDVKSEAEKRIETIRSEVEKVLDKLGQMEIEN